MHHSSATPALTRRYRLYGLLLLLLGWGVSRAWGQTSLNMTGTVKARNGSPKQFVHVQLDGPGRYVAVSNAQGVFTLTNVLPGYYTPSKSGRAITSRRSPRRCKANASS